MIGFFGAHRVGKTTTATALAIQLGYPLVQTTTGQVFKTLGIDPAKPMSFAKRLYVQNVVLDTMQKQWAQHKGKMFVSDRTPLDFITYTLGDVTGDVGKDDFGALESYINRCYEVCNKTFAHIFLIQPGIEIVEDPDKPTAALNRSYMEHFNTLAFGVAFDKRLNTRVTSINRDVLDLKDRVETVIGSIARANRLKFDDLDRPTVFH